MICDDDAAIDITWLSDVGLRHLRRWRSWNEGRSEQLIFVVWGKTEVSSAAHIYWRMDGSLLGIGEVGGLFVAVVAAEHHDLGRIGLHG